MAPRGSIHVDLDPDAAIELVATSFANARGWAIERRGRALSIHRKHSFDYYFGSEPGPSANILQGGVGLEIEARPLRDGGAHVRAGITRHNWPSVFGFVVADLVSTLGFGTLWAAMAALEQRRAHRGGMQRLIGLAIEPLMPHQRTVDPGPFRRRR
ncbi:hypothetical protein [Enhygromyxa salina]|uniref:Uncharacterized protein n=1 Tax=Enhygromyxa salina TaxID=215803 RepID=A0A2S9Y2U1_9BACT|nr:hypothetical protein [Enhygromyxa salina]PRP99351.1 hypothetical protein ENSA7_63930 [Enhygromyxa salina]